MRKLIICGVLFFMCNILYADIVKSNLKVLYVGGSADVATGFGREVEPEVLQKSIAGRIASFEQMLKEYFETVQVIDAAEYKPEMSAQYDVTIMDGKPKSLTTEREITDDYGRKQTWYLPENFDRPVVLIAEMGEILGRTHGLKTDWYCLCLDADAHHFRAGHPIFHRPFAVKMTVELKPTPEDAYHYAYFCDGPLPDSIPMWKVQTKGYRTEKGFRIGMVARPWGFEDSPDAEYISGGVCAKTLDAVAIGRHGNFLHWGFAASPRYMTEEAKAVLANAIVYISEFAGQAPIARKYNDRIATREYLKELKYLSSRRAWQEYAESNQVFDKQMKEMQKAALGKKAKGDSLTEREQMYMNYETPAPMAYEDFLKQRQNGTFEKFGTDEQAYLDYYNSNRDYFYGGEGMYNMVVDEDVKSWEIANNDIKLLEKAIDMWENGHEIEKARRILNRYTLCRFVTPKEWRDWYETNKSRIFFTEAGGWLFMVNSRDPQVAGNDYRLRNQSIPQVKETMVTDDKNPVRIAMRIEEAGNGNKTIVIRMKIHPGYHTYAAVAGTDPFIPTSFGFILPQGWSLAKELQRTSFRQLNDAGTTIYENEAVFRQEIKGSGSGEVKCAIGYQCCDNHICFPPVRKELTVKID